MNDQEINRTPAAFEAILSDTEAVGFNMVSEPRVGSFLAALAASKPAGRFLELGTFKLGVEQAKVQAKGL